MIHDCGLEEDVRRFQAITEYTFISQPTLDEDDDEGDGMDGSQEPSADTPAPVPDVAGGDMQQNMDTTPPSPAPTDNGEQQTPQVPIEDIPTGNGEDIPDEGNEPKMSEPDADDMGGDSEEEVTIDVDSLVKSQEETNAKLDSVSDVLQSFVNTVDMFGQALKLQDEKFAELNAAIKKSNPSEEEILNIRSQSGAPFNQQPKEFWQDKQSTLPNYNVMMDNSVPPSEEQDAAKKGEKYDITMDDISDINTRDIDASFDEPFTLDKFVKF